MENAKTYSEIEAEVSAYFGATNRDFDAELETVTAEEIADDLIEQQPEWAPMRDKIVDSLLETRAENCLRAKMAASDIVTCEVDEYDDITFYLGDCADREKIGEYSSWDQAYRCGALAQTLREHTED